MHISVDARGVVTEVDGSLLEAYLRRLDLSRPAAQIAELLVERGRVRADHMSRSALVAALTAGATTAHAKTAEAWMSVARTSVRLGWTPSKWTVTTEAAAEVHVHVRQGTWL